MFTVLKTRYGLYINNNYLVFKSFKPVGVAYKNLIIYSVLSLYVIISSFLKNKYLYAVF